MYLVDFTARDGLCAKKNSARAVAAPPVRRQMGHISPLRGPFLALEQAA